MPVKKTHAQFVKEVELRFGKEYTVLGEYKNTHTPIKLRHNKCGNIWETTAPYDLLKPKPNGCKLCAVNRSFPLTTEEFSVKLNAIHNNSYTVLQEYKNNKTKILVRHNCGYEFMVKPNSILTEKFNCQSCQKTNSVISDSITEFLNEENLNFIQEKKFKWLKHESLLSIDFYLPDFKIGIEADGEQHYIPKRGGIKEFEKTLKRDLVKFKLCKEHGIEILRIPSFLTKKEISLYLGKLLLERNVFQLD